MTLAAMTTPRKLILSIAFLAAILLSATAIHYYIKWTGPYYLPDIMLETIEGRSIALNSLLGKPVLVVFWASNCDTCLKELPALIQLHNEYKPRGLEVLAIIIYYDDPSDALALVKNRDIPYRILLDRDKKATHAFRDVHYTPTTFLAAPNGRIIYRQQGRSNFNLIREKIETTISD